MGLYQPAKYLQMARNDIQNPLSGGTAHTIGAFIADSILKMCWIEVDLYGPVTVNGYLKAIMSNEVKWHTPLLFNHYLHFTGTHSLKALKKIQKSLQISQKNWLMHAAVNTKC